MNRRATDGELPAIDVTGAPPSATASEAPRTNEAKRATERAADAMRAGIDATGAAQKMSASEPSRATERTTESTRAIYDATANKWVRRAPVALSDFTGRPPTLDLCEPVAGKRILDFGCGEGYCARILMRRDAAEVVGVDLSQKMIDAANSEEARAPLGIRYEQGDVTDLSRFEDRSFDLALGMFVLSYLSFEDTRKCLREMRRVLRPGGRMVAAIPHPLFAFLRDEQPPFYFSRNGAGYFEARDRMFGGRIWRRDGEALDVQVRHKTLEDYFAAMREAGFTGMPIVRELGVTPELAHEDPKFFGPLSGIPLHIAFAVEVPRQENP